MPDEIEFPQESPAIQYIVRQVEKIQDQYACNAGYHKDHRELRRRIDKMDAVLSDLNTTVHKLNIKAINQVQEEITKASKEYLDEVRTTNETELKEIQAVAKALRVEIAESKEALKKAETGYTENQRIFENTVKTMSITAADKVKAAVESAYSALIIRELDEQYHKYCEIALGFLIVGIILGAIGMYLFGGM